MVSKGLQRQRKAGWEVGLVTLSSARAAQGRFPLSSLGGQLSPPLPPKEAQMDNARDVAGLLLRVDDLGAPEVGKDVGGRGVCSSSDVSERKDQ